MPRSAPTPPDASDPVVWLRLHGAPAVGRQGEDGQPLERKDAAWLAVLVLDGATPRDQLAAWLWPEVARVTATGSLRQRIFRLRRRLGHALVQAGERVALLPEVVLAPAGDGQLLDGCDYADCADFADWLARQRERLLARRVEVLEAARARHEADGALDLALAAAQQRLLLEPLSEHALRQLMRLHYLRGDRAAALAAFDRGERLLKDELGARPGPETLALLATVERALPTAVPRRTQVPPGLLRPPRLIGRDHELAELGLAWAAGRVVLLLGEAGLGKTRLLAELAAAQGEPVLHVAARPGDAGVPFALLARLLRALRQQVPADPEAAARRELARVLPELGAGLAVAGEGQRLLLQRAVEQQLGALAETGCRELLVDDLHFADAASLEMLQGLLLSDTLPGLRWGLAQRPAEGGVAALRDALAEARRLHELPLRPLDEAAMRRLVESLGLPELDAQALAGPLVRHTGGNPLFALETLKDLVLRGGAGAAALPQPASVGALIERRLRALSPAALTLARVAAVAGVDFGIELAEGVLGRPALDLADAWSELQAAQVLSGSAFAHDLVFDAVLRTVPAEIAAHVHGGVAQWLQRRDAEAARVAEHWQAAGRWREAAEAFASACRAARHAGRVGDALGLQRRAEAAWQSAGDALQAWRAALDGLELMLVVEGPAAAAATAERLLQTAADEACRAAALVGRAQVHLYEMRWTDAEAAATAALAAAGAHAPAALHIDATRVQAQALASQGLSDRAIGLLQTLQPRVDAEGDMRRRLEHRGALAYALNLAGRPAASAQALRDAIVLAEEVGDTAELLSSLNNLAACELVTGRGASAWRHGMAALRLRERSGVESGPHGLITELNLGLMASAAGRLNEALERLEPAPARLAAAGPAWAALAACHLAWLWMQLGQLHRAEQVLAAAPSLDQVFIQRRRAILLPRLRRLRGEPDAPALQAALQRFVTTPDVKDDGVLRLELGRACGVHEALALARQVGREAAAAGFEGLALHALMREVDLLADVDPGHAAERAAVLAAHDPELGPTDAYAAELPWVLARAAAAVGDTAAQRRWLLAARDWVEATAAALAPGLRRPFLEHNPINARISAALRQPAGNPALPKVPTCRGAVAAPPTQEEPP